MNYTVYFIIKKNCHGYLNQMGVTAKNQKEAVALVRDSVRRDSGRNAFSATCKAPKKVSDGMLFNGMTYTRYSELFNMLWSGGVMVRNCNINLLVKIIVRIQMKILSLQLYLVLLNQTYQ